MGLRREEAMVFIAALLAGLPYLLGGPVWDDHVLIVQGLGRLDLVGLWDLWVQPVGGGTAGASYYRPLAMSVLAFADRAGGVVAIHALAVALHMLAAVGVWRLLQGSRGAVVGALFFALHPLGSEVLGWASALPDVLAVALGVWSALWSRHHPGWALVLLLGASLSKEPGLLIGALGLVLVGAGWRRWLGLAGVAVCVVGLRWWAGVAAPTLGAPSLWAPALAWPLVTVVWPWPLTAVRDLWAVSPGIVPLGMGVLLVGLWGSRGSRAAWAGLALALAVIALSLPTATRAGMSADRYGYPALVGVSAWIASRRWRWPGARLVGAGLVVVALVTHVRRAPAWRADVPLFAAAVRAQPGSSYAWHLLGVSLRHDGHPASAASCFLEAIRTGHPHTLDRQLRLEALVEAGRYEAALAWMRAGPQEDLTAEAVAWWARAAAGAGRPDRARTLLAHLQRPGGWDGPAWVPQLVEELERVD